MDLCPFAQDKCPGTQGMDIFPVAIKKGQGLLKFFCCFRGESKKNEDQVVYSSQGGVAEDFLNLMNIGSLTHQIKNPLAGRFHPPLENPAA